MTPHWLPVLTVHVLMGPSSYIIYCGVPYCMILLRSVLRTQIEFPSLNAGCYSMK